MIAWPSLLLRNRWPSSNEHHRNALLSSWKSYLKQNHIVSTSSLLLQFLRFWGWVEFRSVGALALEGESIWSVDFICKTFFASSITHSFVSPTHFLVYRESWFSNAYMQGFFVSILYYHRLCVVLSAQCIVFVSPLYCVFTWIIKYLYLDCIVFVSEWIKLASRMRSACATTGCGQSRPRLFAFHIRPCVFSTCCIW